MTKLQTEEIIMDSIEPDGQTNILLYILILIALILVNAFFAMSEMAIVSMNDSKIKKLAEQGNKKAQVLLKLTEQPSKFLATIQVGVTISGFLASAIAADTFAEQIVYALRNVSVNPALVRLVSLILITVILSYFTLVFGELVPKRLAFHYSEKIALFAARPLSALNKFGKPFVAVLSSSTNAVLRMLGINPDQKTDEVTEEEIRMMIDAGNESGHIEESDKDMLNNIFEFDDRTAEEVMTHRTEVTGIEQDALLDEIVAVALETGYSRIPIFEDDLDSIVGILYVKDLLKLVMRDPGAQFQIADYMREPLYVLESTNCKVLLKEFKDKKIQMAVVVDEYGGTSGIVTMEDLLEFIVGNIQDEYDDEEEEIYAVSEDRFIVDGLASLESVIKYFDLNIEDEDDFETIGGYVVSRLGHIPVEDEHPSIAVGSYLFTVLAMDERRIEKIAVDRQAAEQETITEEITAKES